MVTILDKRPADLPASVFDSRTVPGITPDDYIQRLLGKYERLVDTPTMIAVTTVLMRRLVETEPCTVYNFHRMYAAAYTTAFYLLSDPTMKKQEARHIMGIPDDELCDLTVTLGMRLDWKMGDIITQPEIIESVRDSLFN